MGKTGLPVDRVLRSLAETASVIAIQWLCVIVPRFSRKTVWRMAHGIGWLAYYVLAGHRKRALANLQTAFPDSLQPERRRIARASFQNLITTLLHLFWSPRMDQRAFRRLVDIAPEHMKVVRRVRARGRPVVAVGVHYGDWEMSVAAMGFLGLPTAISPCQGEGGVFRLGSCERGSTRIAHIFSRLRALPGNSTATSYPQLLSRLLAGDAAGLLVDLNGSFRRGGAWLDFFGKPTFSRIECGQVARASGGVILFGVARPRPEGRVQVEFQEVPYDPAESDEAITQRILDLAEREIRVRPENWLWCYRRWKYRPHREQGSYPYYSRYRESMARWPVPGIGTRSRLGGKCSANLPG